MEEKNYQYMVGVQCMTFNQSRYILDTLNGFVMQQTNFPFVIMVVDDASTDGEQEVIAKYISEQFDTADSSVAYEKKTDYAHISYAQHKTNKNCYIAVLYLKENLYSQGKSEDKLLFLSEWRDNIKYETLCEGDDYWIHPQKLQIQVDFLEKNEEYGLVYGKAKTYIQNNNNWGDTIGSKRECFEDLLLENNIPTLTTMYRVCALEGYDKLVDNERRNRNWKMGDYPMWLFISMSYKIHFFDETLAVYRVLDNSASHSIDYEKNIEFLSSTFSISSFFYKMRQPVSVSIKMIHENHLHELYHLAIENKKWKDAKDYFSKIQNPTIKERLINFIFCSLKRR